MNSNLFLAAKSGLIATAAMTLLMLGAPMMGMPEMPVGKMLAGFFHLPVAAGWVMHFFIGIVLAAGYLLFLDKILPGNALIRGLLYSFIPFFLAQTMVMPMMTSTL